MYDSRPDSSPPALLSLAVRRRALLGLLLVPTLAMAAPPWKRAYRAQMRVQRSLLELQQAQAPLPKQAYQQQKKMLRDQERLMKKSYRAWSKGESIEAQTAPRLVAPQAIPLRMVPSVAPVSVAPVPPIRPNVPSVVQGAEGRVVSQSPMVAPAKPVTAAVPESPQPTPAVRPDAWKKAEPIPEPIPVPLTLVEPQPSGDVDNE